MAGVRRKVLAKSSVPTQRAQSGSFVSKLAGGNHWHSCKNQDCRAVFVDACQTPEVNGTCDICRRGYSTPYMGWKEPKDCCYEGCELMKPTDPWMQWLKLAGPGPWYQCFSCKRAHGWPLV